MNETPKTCQLCGSSPLRRMEVPGANVLHFCSHCDLYQYGALVPDEAYESAYHAGYDRHRARKVRTARARLARLAALIDERRGAIRMLEIGCSVGATLQAAEERGWQAHGVDVSRSAVAACTSRGLQATVVGACELPFDDGRFDVVCAWHVIEHVEEIRQTLREWTRVLRPGGLLVIETPDAECPKARRLGARYRKFWAPEHTYTFSRRSLEAFFREAGLEIEQEPGIGAVATLAWSDRGYAAAQQFYHRLRRRLGLEKAFQLFARRPLAESVANRRAA